MSKKDERYLNIILNDNKDDKDEVVISFSAIFKMLKKYFLIWLVVAVVAAALIFTGSAFLSSDQHKNLSALVSFSYDGIEEGLDPSGNTFDVNSIKSPSVIKAALVQLDMPLEELENIRQNIRIEGVIPTDAMDKITTYKSVYENANGGNLNAAQAMLDVTYYPTQYKVYFNYAATSFSGSDAVQVFNTILDCYRDYFFQHYGYNEALGSAVSALDYNDYDYAEAVDVFDTSLTTLQTYVSSLSVDDTTRFRSNTTGYTFADLSKAIETVRTMDLEILSSYITVNNVTKDKTSLINYYQYRIDTLTREKTVSQERLNSITDTIKNYEKDVVMIFGNGTDNTDTQYSQSGEEYGELITQKIETQTQLSTANQQINFYNQRIKALNGQQKASDEHVAKVEEDLKKLNTKVNDLIDNINKTADEYYSNVSFADAYSVLVPAISSGMTVTKSIIKTASTPILLAEAVLAVIYIIVAFIQGLIYENKKRAVVKKAEEAQETEAAEETEEK